LDARRSANADAAMSCEQRVSIVRGYASAAGFAREQVNKDNAVRLPLSINHEPQSSPCD
jgi:hypothetical protein